MEHLEVGLSELFGVSPAVQNILDVGALCPSGDRIMRDYVAVGADILKVFAQRFDFCLRQFRLANHYVLQYFDPAPQRQPDDVLYKNGVVAETFDEVIDVPFEHPASFDYAADKFGKPLHAGRISTARQSDNSTSQIDFSAGF